MMIVKAKEDEKKEDETKDATKREETGTRRRQKDRYTWTTTYLERLVHV